MPSRADRPPSFVLFITDQHRADFLGCYGNSVVRTPHIDSIAAHGTAFDRFYVASPVCMPNRATLMTGRMPSVHGVRSNGIPLSCASVTFVDLLRAAGYATGLVGKSHLQNFTGTPPFRTGRRAPESYRAPPAELAEALRDDRTAPFYRQEGAAYWSDPANRIAAPFYGFDHVDLVTGHGDDLGGDYLRWLLHKRPDARALIGTANGLPHAYCCPQAHRTAVPPELYSTTYIGERATEFLDAQADSPFFLMVSFPDPHHPFNPPGAYWDMYKPEQFDVPQAFTRNDWVPPPHVASRLSERAEGRANINGVNTVAVTPREAQEARALTAGMIALIDDTIGSVLTHLGQSGRADNTVVMFTADHGEHLGDHKLLLKGAEQYQSIIRVPFIWRDPTMGDAPQRTQALASTMDIPASVLDRAGLEPFAGLQGRSLLATIDNPQESPRDAVLIQYDHQRPDPGLGQPPRVHTLVEADWRISVFDGVPWGELYDLGSDPGEFVNQWDAPAHATTRARLMERVARAEIEYIDRVPRPTELA